MAISVRFLDGNKGVEFSLSGEVHGRDIIKAHSEFHTQETNSSLKYKIIDKSSVKQNFISPDEVRTISSLDNEIIKNYPNILILIVIPRDADIITTQQWTALSSKNHQNIHFFTSRNEANEWIKDNVSQA